MSYIAGTEPLSYGMRIIISFLICIVLTAAAYFAFHESPHDQLERLIRETKRACVEPGPQDNYQRKVCMLVMP